LSGLFDTGELRFLDLFLDLSHYLKNLSKTLGTSHQKIPFWQRVHLGYEVTNSKNNLCKKLNNDASQRAYPNTKTTIDSCLLS
jgi:hypothetical protein